MLGRGLERESIALNDVQGMIDREVRGSTWVDLPPHRRRLFLPGLMAVEGLFLHLGVKRIAYQAASVKRGLISFTSMLPPAV